MSTDHEQRLRSEAEFQDRRVAAAHEGKTEVRDRFYFLAEPAMQRYNDALGDLSGKRVLVVGCSEGGVTPIARKGARVTGIDIAPEAISGLNDLIKREGLQDRADAMVMDAMNPDFPDSTFDLICCTGVLHHLDTHQSAVAWSRILKPTGRVVMLEPMAWNPAVAVFRMLTPSMRTPDEHPLTPKDFSLLKRSFDAVQTHAYVMTSVLALGWLIVPDFWDIRRRTSKVLGAVDRALLSVIPPLKYFCWTAVIELRQPRKS
jgi:SAM-dependent methyltransferase